MGKPGRPTGIRKIYTPEERMQYQKYYQTRSKSSWDLLITRRLYAAQNSGKPVSITKDQVIEQLEKQNYRCYYSGIPLDLKSPKLQSPSIDRLDNTKGYEPGNVVICLWIINRAKFIQTESEFLEMCKSVSNWKENKNTTKEK